MFILCTEQEKEEGGKLYSIQRFSSDLASEGELRYANIRFNIKTLSSSIIMIILTSCVDESIALCSVSKGETLAPLWWPP